MYRVAAISDLGWVEDPEMTLNHIFTYYLLTDAAQTLLFEGEVISLSKTYYKFINDPVGMAGQVMTDLQQLLGKYFSQVDVICTAKESTKKHYGIAIRAAVTTEDNTRLELSKVMEIDTAHLRKVISVNNYGDGLSLIENI